MKIHFRNELLDVNFAFYGNGRTAIHLTDQEGIPYMKATVNIPNIELDDDEVIIKNYSENEGILASLLEERIISPPVRYIESGFIECPVCKLLIDI